MKFSKTLSKLNLIVFAFAALALASCSPSSAQLKKVLEDNPDILTSAIKKNPEQIITALNDAAKEARQKQAENQEKSRDKEMEEEFKNPKKPVMDEARAMMGPKDAQLVLVEYSDFQCPYCSRGFQVVQELKKKYEGKIRFHFKHLPLDFHPMALPAAKYFEAIALQSPEKAYKFHDAVFSNQEKLTQEQTKFLDKVAKEVGADVKKMKADLDSPKVMDRINADKAEANKFEFFGTPGFLINGVSLKGAYPVSEFEKVIARLQGAPTKK